MKKFEQIYWEIKEQIQSGQLSAGMKLLSENSYCQKYSVSRGTIRKALDLLAQDGLINAQHGKGAYVLDHDPVTFSFGTLVSFAEANQDSNNRFSTNVVSFANCNCPDELAKLSNFPLQTSLAQIIRVRKLAGERVIVDINYFDSQIIAGLNSAVAAKSIYKHIEQTLGLKIGFARRTIEVAPITELDKDNLDLKNYSLVAVVKNWVYLSDGRLFEYTESHHRPDRFIFNEFVRRR